MFYLLKPKKKKKKAIHHKYSLTSQSEMQVSTESPLALGVAPIT